MGHSPAIRGPHSRWEDGRERVDEFYRSVSETWRVPAASDRSEVSAALGVGRVASFPEADTLRAVLGERGWVIDASRESRPRRSDRPGR
jgi:hypothetical protein